MSGFDLNRQNFLVGCIAAVSAFGLALGFGSWAGVEATRSVTERTKAKAEMCQSIERPEDRITCALAVTR